MLIHSKNAKDTEKLAEYLAGKILAGGPHKHAVVISLIGELGAGKTHFVKAFMRALGINETITSPTFNIMKIYGIATSDKRPASSKTASRGGLATSKFKSAYHIDAYRIKSADLLKLGFKEIIKDPANIVLIEWADIVKDILPKDALNIRFEHGVKEGERKIKLS